MGSGEASVNPCTQPLSLGSPVDAWQNDHKGVPATPAQTGTLNLAARRMDDKKSHLCKKAVVRVWDFSELYSKAKKKNLKMFF